MFRNLSAIILFMSTGLMAQDRLDRAIQLYEEGLVARSQFDLTVALENLKPERQLDAGRLKAFLALAQGRIRDARQELAFNVAARPDPFLSYVLARIYLNERDFVRARDQYRLAANPDPATKLNTNESEIPEALLQAFAPIDCGESPIIEQPFEIFRRHENSGVLWRAKMNSTSRSQAATQATILSRRFGGVGPAVPPWKESFAKVPLVFGILKDPSDETTFGRCSVNLGEREKAVRDRLRAGSADKGKDDLLQIQERKAELLRNRVFLFNDIASHIYLGRYLAFLGRRQESLHVFRAAIKLQLKGLTFFPNEHDTVSTYASFAALLRDLAAVYSSLDRDQDAIVLKQISTELEGGNYQDAKKMTALRQQLFLLAGQNMRCTETLWLLMKLDPNRQATYRARLSDRDEKFSNVELLEVFRPIYDPGS
ncbi:MAG: hypothetical protein K8S54_01595 [Spirochaetia bacterium]|nr:hypothetical protein [Spirochaetia bacterium]